jgi:carboxylesterase
VVQAPQAPFEHAGDRRGVLVLHGFTGTPWEVRPLCQRLAERGLTVSAPLLAGHGTTARALAATRATDWEQSAALALHSLRARTDRVAVAGLSMGGLLGLQLCQRYPETIAALILMAVPLGLPRPMRAAVRALVRVGVPWAIPKLGGSDVRDRAMAAQNPGYRQFPLRAVAELCALQDAVAPTLHDIHTPTLVLHGFHDHTAPRESARAISDALGSRDVRLRFLAQSYHLLPVDVEREEVARLVGDFVEEKLACPSS